MRAVICVVMLVACTDPHVKVPANAAAVADDPSWQTCTTDGECAVVEVGCSDLCGGGRVIAVRREHADDARREYREGLSCEVRKSANDSCRAEGAICRAGRCGYRWSHWSEEQHAFLSLERATPLPGRCEVSGTVDCERACEGYARFWSTANACRSAVLQNGQDGEVPVMVQEDGAPYDPAACTRICRGDLEPGMAREAQVGWACYARSASCTDWSTCYRACRRW